MTDARPLTGRKVLVITLGAFAVILGANLTLLYAAIGSFPGLEVRNSYVASQVFDVEREAQERLGWSSAVAYADGVLDLRLTGSGGAPARPAAIAARIGRMTTTRDDRVLDLTAGAAGWSAALDLDPGPWAIWIEATAADGTAFRQRLPFSVPVRP